MIAIIVIKLRTRIIVIIMVITTTVIIIITRTITKLIIMVYLTSLRHCDTGLKSTFLMWPIPTATTNAVTVGLPLHQ